MVAVQSRPTVDYKPRVQAPKPAAAANTAGDTTAASTGATAVEAKAVAQRSTGSAVARRGDMALRGGFQASALHAQFDKPAAQSRTTPQSAATAGTPAAQAKDLIDSHKGGFFGKNLDEVGLGKDLAGRVAADPAANGPVADAVFDQLSGNRLFGDDKQQVARAFVDELTDPQLAELANTEAGRNTLAKAREMIERSGVNGAEAGQVDRINQALRPEDLDGIVAGLEEGRIDDDMRAAIGEHFTGLDMAGSHEAMNQIRDAGLMDTFLQATLRDDEGNPTDPALRSAIGEMMAPGNLDVYAETLATTSFQSFDPTAPGAASEHNHFNPGTDGVYIRNDTLASDGITDVLAHETFHAFAHNNGSTGGAIDEGFGIAAAAYNRGDAEYNVSEMVYGTKNFYRDNWDQPDYPLGNWDSANPKLQEFVDALSSRDLSGFATNDPATAEAEYDEFWAPLDRDVADFNDWLKVADQATQDMIAARD